MTPYDLIEQRLQNGTELSELIQVLYILLNGDFAVWEDGSLYSIRQLVARFEGLKVEIYSREHPPPHFHVKGGDVDVSFSIDNCELIEGKLDGRRTALIQFWHSRCKDKLIDFWNATRPDGCSVGVIRAGGLP